MSQIIKNDKNLDKVPKFRKQLNWSKKKNSFSNERPFKILAGEGLNVLMQAVVGAQLFTGYGVCSANDVKVTHL